MAAAAPTSGRNSVSVHTGLPGSLAQPPPHGPFRDFEPRRGQPPMGGCRIPAAVQLAEPLDSRPAPIRVSPRHQAPRTASKTVEHSADALHHLDGSARTDLSAADGRASGRRQERGRSLAGTYNLGGWFTAAGGRRPSEDPVPDVRPEGSGQRPRRPGEKAIRAATAAWLGVTNRCKVVSRGRAAPPRHRVPVPARGAPSSRAAAARLRGPGRVHPGTHRGGVRAV